MRMMKTILHNMMCRSCREWGRGVRSLTLNIEHGTLNFEHGRRNSHSSFFILICSFFIFHCSLFTSSCSPEPPLHLYDDGLMSINLPAPKLKLEVLWNYNVTYSTSYAATFKTAYDWHYEWYYGWNDEDRARWGEPGYTEPTMFYLRRYYTGNLPYGPHLRYDKPELFYGNHYQGFFDWGFWDILVYNEPQVNVISVRFDESDPDNITAYTGPTSYASRYHAPRYSNAFYPPEPLFTAYKQAEEINENLDGFDYDKENDVWVREIPLELLPVTYIYLTQIIIRNNKGRIDGIDGVANLSGMARTTNLNTSRAGDDAITVNYQCHMKENVPLVRYSEVLDPSTATVDPATAERVDIIGGRLMTFGICGLAPLRDIDEENMKPEEIEAEVNRIDKNEHYIDFTATFSNGTTATISRNVTDQVRKLYKGGVITVEIDVDKLEIPDSGGGSGFDAVVKDLEYVEVPDISL